MRFWNVIGTVTRYVLAAVSCISIAQFLLLLNVGTENAGRLAGQALGRGVITGLVAAVWFFSARKARPVGPVNVQTQTQLPLFEKSQLQTAPPPRDSVSAAATASAPAADHSVSSFLEEHVIGLIIAFAMVVTIVTLKMTTPWMFALSTGTSQPRFIYVQGTRSYEMFDNKTGQTCINSPIARDSEEKINDDLRQFAIARGEEPHKLNFYSGYGYEGTMPARPETDWTHLPRVDYQKFYDRYNALMKNPNNPPIYHYNGMPYCKEL